MEKMRLLGVLIAAIFGVMPISAAHAAWDPAEPGLHFSLGLSEKHDSNVTQAPDGAGRIDSNVFSVAPALRLLGKDGANSFQLDYAMLYEKYSEFSDGDHTDHHLTNRNYLEFNIRNSLTLDFAYHEIQAVQDSVNRSDPAEEEGNQSHYTDAGFNYRYGAPGAAGKLEMGGSYRWLRYDNNLNTSSLNRFKERDTATAAAKLFVRIAPKTHTVFEFRLHESDYEDDAFRLSNQEVIFLTGAVWEATGKTTGSVKVGAGKRDFDDGSKDDGDYAKWEMDLRWAPQQHSSIFLVTSRVLQDGSARENYIEASTGRVGWEHEWSDRVTSTLAADYVIEAYNGSVNDDRDDKTLSGELRIDYEWRRWLSVGIGYTHKDRESNFANEQFKRNIYGIDFVFFL